MKYMLANLGSSISTSRIAISDGAEAHGAAILQKFLLKVRRSFAIGINPFRLWMYLSVHPAHSI